MESKNLNLLTLCSGIGSPEVAAMRVHESVNVVAACEIDKFARQTYTANFDIDPKHYHEDVTKMDGTQYHGNVDRLVGGFPCQAFSVAGKRLGLEDTRGTIFFDFVRLLKEIEPKVFVFENVKGLVGHDKEKDEFKTVTFDTLFGKSEKQVLVKKAKKYWSTKHPKREIGKTLHIMEKVLDDAGYFWTWDVLNTKDFGVPQNRERIFMVGFKDEEDFKNFSFPTPFALEKRLKDVLEEDVGERYYLSEQMTKKLKLNSTLTSGDIKTIGHSGTGGQKGDIVLPMGISSCLTSSDYKQPKQIMVAGMLDIKGTEQIRRVHEVGGVAPSLTTMQGGHQEPKIIQGGFPKLFRVRKLTPLECFRLQDFPDSFKKVVSNSQLYKQAGNSMSVNVMEAIERAICDALAFKREDVVLSGLFEGVA